VKHSTAVDELSFEVLGIVPFLQRARPIVLLTVYKPAALNCRAFRDEIRPTLDVTVFVSAQKLGYVVSPSKNQDSIPGEDRDIGDCVVIAGDKGAIGKLSVEHIKLPLHLHRIPIDGIFDFDRGVAVKVGEAPSKIR
jgi:hypothetical protein